MTQSSKIKTRWVQHLTRRGVSIAVDVSSPVLARVTLTVCNPKDRFSRKAARFFLNLRLDGDEAVLNSLGMKRNVFTFPYNGNMPKRDILIPLMDQIRNELGYEFNYVSKMWYVDERITPRVDRLIRIIRNFTPYAPESGLLPAPKGSEVQKAEIQQPLVSLESMNQKISELTLQLRQACIERNRISSASSANH